MGRAKLGSRDWEFVRVTWNRELGVRNHVCDLAMRGRHLMSTLDTANPTFKDVVEESHWVG